MEKEGMLNKTVKVEGRTLRTIFLLIQAILAYKFIPLKHGGQKAVHVALLGIAMVIGAPGIYAIFKFQKETRTSRGMYSLHSWLGLSTIILFIFQWVIGLCVFLYPRLPDKRRAIFLPRHKIAGLFIYGIAIFTAVTGFTEKLLLFEVRGLNQFGAEAMLVNATAVITILFGMFVVLSALLP
ncbi:probable ascorbate-specific transmembrane electron transporter 1 [Cryptomeria japonica]|uniref:probable ascorbate-specific transmembrane electron transporter 1 n=1 Tax=Cryptomeria japonica TaxID=3369 RepID=UPI0027DA1783|nr:probable ascorbate-specific transmembrane electron transporter 1 [Cryptomeria japonica]